jgi:hypothetical protein
MRRVNTWEKTRHIGAHRTQPALGGQPVAVTETQEGAHG